LLSRLKDLAVIARDCGFAHQSHFTSRFKQATGLTPTKWRRMMTERENAVAG
jgi:AraC family transcriptional regulator